jgi:hypothetical protein
MQRQRHLEFQAAAWLNFADQRQPLSSKLMQHSDELQLSMTERTERALLLLAYFIELDGDVHLATFEKFEIELDELRRKEGVKERPGASSPLIAATAVAMGL